MAFEYHLFNHKKAPITEEVTVDGSKINPGIVRIEIGELSYHMYPMSRNSRLELFLSSYFTSSAYFVVQYNNLLIWRPGFYFSMKTNLYNFSLFARMIDYSKKKHALKCKVAQKYHFLF